eukprot:TRINITY_DN50430_c0_g1_i1.p2 TRINITY_DN50430_c0_g1~~TRINITY_DN50430_c0_g1_i1.p2  ORF type:complete len:135 (+),score=50.40 TRINITY_DN50430_c0_g1_i1:80-484(+)
MPIEAAFEAGGALTQTGLDALRVTRERLRETQQSLAEAQMSIREGVQKKLDDKVAELTEEHLAAWNTFLCRLRIVAAAGALLWAAATIYQVRTLRRIERRLAELDRPSEPPAAAAGAASAAAARHEHKKAPAVW